MKSQKRQRNHDFVTIQSENPKCFHCLVQGSYSHRAATLKQGERQEA